MLEHHSKCFGAAVFCEIKTQLQRSCFVPAMPSCKRPASSMASHGRKETVLISENSLPDGGRLKDDNHMNWEAKMEQLQEEWVDMVNHNRKFMYRGLDGK